MAGGVIKLVELTQFGRFPTPASPALYRGGSPALWRAWRLLCQAQDTALVATRRVLCALPFPAGTLLYGDPAIPIPDNVGLTHGGVFTRVVLSPGCVPRVSILALPSGVVADQTLEDTVAGNGGVQVTVSYDGLSVIRSINIPAAGLEFEPSGSPGNHFGQVSPNAASTLLVGSSTELIDEEWRFLGSEFEPFSEAPEVDISIDRRGMPYPIDIIVYEVPFKHAQQDTPATPQSAHCFVVGGQTPQTAQTVGPQENAPGVGVIDEVRFGTHQLLDVAYRQLESISPLIFAWSAWSTDAIDGGDDERQFLTRGSDSGSVLLGWVVDAVHCLDPEMTSPTMPPGCRAVFVRVRVEARRASGTCTIRVAAGSEFVDVPITSTSFAVVTRYGWLECQVTGDQPGLIGDVEHIGAACDLRSVSIERVRTPV